MSRIFESCLKSLPQGCFDCVFNGECAEKQLYEKGRADAIEDCISLVNGCLIDLPVTHDKTINVLCQLKEQE